MSRTFVVAIVCLSLLPTSVLVAADPFMPTNCRTTVVRVHSTDPTVLTSVAAWTEPWAVRFDEGYFIVDVDDIGFGRLEALGVRLEIDTKRTAEICAPRFRLPGQVTGIPGYECYRTVEETFASAAQIVAENPTLAELVDAGDSWEKFNPGGSAGYDMWVLKLTNSLVAGTPTGDGQGKPVFFITSAIHAREYATAELATRFAEYLVDNYGTDADATWLLDEHEIHIMLHTNPDGRKQAEGGDSWRKNTNENYCSSMPSSRGADLNRNFTFQWGCCGGSSGSDCDGTFRGPTAASEPETQAVETYANVIFPDQRDDAVNAAAPDDATGLYIDIHSFGQEVLWPWGFDTNNDPPNGAAYRTLGRKLAYFNDYNPVHHIYPVDGDTIDSIYGHLGVASFVFELGTSFFQPCSSFEATVFPDNLTTLVYAAKIARTPYLTPQGPEVVDLAAADGNFIAPDALLEISANADDTRFNHTNGTQPTGTVAGARCSINSAPWTDPAPAFQALSASDGVFDTGIEPVEASITTTGLAVGQHTLFCQAQDDTGQWGPVSALFIWIMDPATTPHVAGAVTSAEDGAPLEAEVTVGGINSVITDPATGAYDLMVPEGIYSVTATPTDPDHGSHTVTDVTATLGETTTVDFQLQPFEVTLADDAEAGPQGWTAQSPWALTTEAAHSGSYSWTDSPGSNYADYEDTSLTSAPFDLSFVSNVQLLFFHTYSTEAGYDYAIVEYSADGGSTWDESARWDGANSGWEAVVLSLPDLDGAAAARIRFRLDSDSYQTDDGWHIDDIIIRGTAVDVSIFADGFESGNTTAWSDPTP